MLVSSVVQWCVCCGILIAAIILHNTPSKPLHAQCFRLYIFAFLLFVHSGYFFVLAEDWFSDMAMLSLLIHTMHLLQLLRFFFNPLRYLTDVVRMLAQTFVVWCAYFVAISRCRGFLHIDVVFLALLIIAMYFLSQKSDIHIHSIRTVS